MVIKMYDPLFSDKVALKDMAALEEQYLGMAAFQYAAVRRCAAFENMAGRAEFCG